ncbi:MAG: catalase [Bacilli bacterium]|nr:catalase [Bacilli bacterium]
MGKAFLHFRTICKHRHQVIRNGFHMGIFWQCLWHDLSKFGYTEFHYSAQFYQGDHSPVLAERKEHGYFSFICQHHTSKNKHHWEYWTDFFMGKIICCTMPWKYATELVCDMLSASKTYEPAAFSGKTVLEYFEKRKSLCYMSKATELYVEWCLGEYADNGWRNLGKKQTKARYEAICQENPKFEVFDELRNREPLPDWQNPDAVL